MADIKPFRAVRPKTEYAADVASLPYDVFSEKEARQIVKENPHTFLKISRPETAFAEGCDIYADEVYKKAKNLLEGEILKGILIQEKKNCYYIYTLTINGRSQTGLVACFSADDYLNNVIKKHENTRKDKEEDRTRHIDICNAQTGPVFLAYKERKSIDEITDAVMQEEPLFDFIAKDGVRQQIWRVDAPETVENITKAFAKIDSVYIADGHHRCASAVRIAEERRKEYPGYDGNEEFNYILGVAFPDSQLCIMPYNRVIKDLNGMSVEDFLMAINSVFEVTRLDEGYSDTVDVSKGSYGPKEKYEMNMYLDGHWYKLETRAELKIDDAVDGLDVSILQNNVLSPILGIEDPRTDERIDFVGGIKGLKELEKRCSEDMRLAFALYPTSIKELIRVTDEGRLMPPKSTWFEPKLQSGLFVHKL